MKAPLSLLLFASACWVSGCSSAPLSPAPDSVGGPPGAAAGTASGADTGTGTGSAGTGAVPSTSPTPTLTSDWVAYPAGPYGTVRGATIANLEFLGWKHPDLANYDTKSLETVRLSDFYNPDGHTNTKLLAVNASAVWCSVCRAEYEDMNTNGTYATYHAEGVEILGTLFQDQNYFPAEPLDLTNWGKVANHSVKFPLVIDPGFKMGAYFSSDATPLNMLVDARTMTILAVTMGYSTTYWDDVQTLLDKLQ